MKFKCIPGLLMLCLAIACVGVTERATTQVGGQGGGDTNHGGGAVAGDGEKARTGGTSNQGGMSGGSIGTSSSGGTRATGGTETGNTGGTRSSGDMGGTVGMGGQGGIAGTTAPESWLVSDNFERGSLDPVMWTDPTLELSTIAVQNKVFAHGSNALRITVESALTNGGHNRHANVSLRTVPAGLKGDVFLRMYVRFAQDPAFKNVMFFAGTGGAEYGSSTAFGTFPKDATSGEWFGQLSNSVGGNNIAIATGVWICIEAQWQSSPSRLTMYGDGKLLFMQNGPEAPDFSKITIGFGSGHSPDHDFEMFIDDFAMDTRRVGCL